MERDDTLCRTCSRPGYLSSPDYGDGLGATYSCCCNGYRKSWGAHSRKAQEQSTASRSLSAANAALRKRKAT